MFEVTLKPYEMQLAEAVARARQASAVERGRADRYGFDGDPLGVHINGAAGELAASIAYNVPWTGCYYRDINPKPPDIGTQTDIRTRSRDWYDLIVHPEDPDDRWFVLVLGAPPSLKVMGRIRGDSAKQRPYWKDPAGNRPAYFVPQAALRQPRG